MKSRAIAPRLKLLRGFMTNGVFSLESDRFIVTVNCHAYGMAVTTRPNPSRAAPPGWYVKCERFLPYLVRFLFRFFQETPMEIVLPALLVLGFLGRGAWQEAYHPHAHQSFYEPLGLMIITTSVVGLILADRLSTAYLYGAQRKVMNAYLKEGRFDRETVLRQSRIIPLSTERFFAPLMASPFLASGLHIFLGVNTLWIHVALVEVLLQVDARIGLENIRFTRHLSTLIQEHLTTSEPTPSDLAVAETALEVLLNAHQRLWESLPLSERAPHLKLIR